MPRWPNSTASATPTGPPPTIATSYVSFMLPLIERDGGWMGVRDGFCDQASVYWQRHAAHGGWAAPVGSLRRGTAAYLGGQHELRQGQDPVLRSDPGWSQARPAQPSRRRRCRLLHLSADAVQVGEGSARQR